MVTSFPTQASAGHGVALLVGNDVELASAFESRGFVTTVKIGDDLQNTVENFAKSVPTKGVAVIYVTGGMAGAADILKQLHDESGAAFSIVIVEGQKKTTDLEFKNAVICLAPKGSRDALIRQINNRQTNLVSALCAAMAETKGSCSATRETLAPPLCFAISPPGEVREGIKAGDEWVNPLGTVFCWCPPGSGPGFWLGKYEMTKREFDLVTRKNPRGAIATSPNHPRDCIRYDDILQFTDELNRRERFFKRLPDEWEYALPSETEWEYACRARTETPFYFGTDSDQLSTHANFADAQLFATGDDYYHYADRRFDDGHPHLAMVGSYPSNPWGFHDMYGNLWEWTSSRHPDEVDLKSQGSPVACGGSWVSLPAYLGSDSRHQFEVPTERNFIGFRIALRRKEN